METLSQFSLVLRLSHYTTAQPPLALLDVTCEQCLAEFSVRSPEDATAVLNQLVVHARNCFGATRS